MVWNRIGFAHASLHFQASLIRKQNGHIGKWWAKLCLLQFFNFHANSYIPTQTAAAAAAVRYIVTKNVTRTEIKCYLCHLIPLPLQAGILFKEEEGEVIINEWRCTKIELDDADAAEDDDAAEAAVPLQARKVYEHDEGNVFTVTISRRCNRSNRFRIFTVMLSRRVLIIAVCDYLKRNLGIQQ